MRYLLALSVLGLVLALGNGDLGRALWAGYQTVHGEYYGSSSRINAWDLKLKPGQTSSSSMWLLADGGNQIMAGFHISPDVYNDTNLHFFVSWTGFVSAAVAHPAGLSPGSTVAQPSVYHGRQTDFTITVLKDGGNWSIYQEVAGKQEAIGYFPGSLFTGLAEHATVVGWGGGVQATAGSAAGAPPMGCGHGPGEGPGGSAYVASIGVVVVNSGGKLSFPAVANVTSLTDAQDCYDVSVFQVKQDGDSGGGFFYYGGPGGCNH
ncbi:hypothetical protein E2562_018368 [Oryza meyeriana var. granulata]|uniref:Neprosin PEP catalytic domain-containing protein n=1 Tax=Oryza meyeriana var. granulata TaxID=110450 RepID=A0A6G1D578_9ORYZ|nr:hypothetical protein E2562_018368 [Oryza meyeriana var. granulata]